MSKRKVAIIVGVILFLTAGASEADDTVKPLPSPHVRLKNGTGELVGPDGQRYFLPVGTHVLDGTSWDVMENEHKRLQDQETRLEAENKSLRDTIGSGWRPGWLPFVTALVVGVSLGAGGYYWYTNR